TYGPDLHLLHDVHHRLKPVEAARLGKELEPFRLFWMEDAVPVDFQEGFRLIRHHTVTPLAVGEVFNSVHDCQTLITAHLIDYIRMTIVHGGGITPLVKLDRKSTRLNSRHVKISYAVFCLKNKIPTTTSIAGSAS